MDIYEMHVLFRTLGQQQGLELIRGILPESIDTFINDSIVQNVRVAVLGNVQPAKDVRTPQYTKISHISQISTLYCTEESSISAIEEGSEVQLVLTETPLCITNFVLKYKDNKKVDCRLIESERLYQTLNDYLNRASRDYPIISLVNGNSDKSFEINLFTGDNNKDVEELITSYIKMPKKVYFDEENNNNSISCDLPEHLHYQIVETAVELWFQSLGLTSERQTQQNNNQNNQ